MQALPEHEAFGDRRRRIDRAELGHVLVADLAVTPAGLDQACLQAGLGLAEADVHCSGTVAGPCTLLRLCRKPFQGASTLYTRRFTCKHLCRMDLCIVRPPGISGGYCPEREPIQSAR